MIRQKLPDYFSSIEEYKKYERDDRQTNPRYKTFTQVHFTAGDSQQFQLYRDKTNGELCVPLIKPEGFPVRFDFWKNF